MEQVKRVFLGSIATETNTFSPLRTDLQDFKDSFYAPPGQHPETPTLCSAIYPVARSRAAQYGWQLVEGTATWAEPGGIVNQQTWEHLRDQLLSELRAAMPVDIVLLGLHGAMVAQDCLDCEGELIASVRDVVGPNVIVGATFDPHSHLSACRVENADLITVFKEFPHTDFVDVAEDLVDLVQRAATGQINPAISTYDCRMIEVLPTSRQPMRGFIDRIKELENDDKVLSVSVIHGFMAGDVPDLGTKI
ncbi:MAG: M81 family metallopeptidase, partial [Alphaproteobacteria bacterium]